MKVSDEDWSDAEYQQLIKKYKLGQSYNNNDNTNDINRRMIILFILFSFLVNKILSLIQSVSTEGVYDVREKIKVYDRLGDMCANKDYEFYEAAVKFYQKEVTLENLIIALF